MPLFKTTTEHEHYHIAYIAEGGAGIASVDDKHSHMINPEPQPDSDLMNYRIDLVQEHTHELMDYDIQDPTLKQEEESVVVNDILKDEYEAIEYERDSFEVGYVSEDMYMNRQW